MATVAVSPEKNPLDQWWDTWKVLPQWERRPLGDLTAVVDELLARGVPVEAKATGYMYEGMTALHYAAQLCTAPDNWGIDLLRYLFEKKGVRELVNTTDEKHGLTPLLHALAHGADATDVNGIATETETEIEGTGEEAAASEAEGDAVGEAASTMEGARRSLLQALDIFIEHGANVNFVPFITNGQSSSSASKYTALGIAAAKSDVNLLVNLIKAGAKVNVKRRTTTSDDDYPVVHPLYTAALHGNIDVCKLLLEYGACVDTGANQGTVIHAAAYAHNQDLIELFVKCGVDINCTDQIGETALFTAARSYDLPLVKALVSHGADVNAVTRSMCNALAEVCTMNLERPEAKREVLQCLLDAGCNIDQKGFRGQNALHHAARTGDADTALLLLQSGADPNLLTDYGLRPIQVAFCHHTLSSSYLKTIRHLIDYNSDWSHEAGLRNCRFICPCSEDCHIRAIHMMYLAGCPVRELRALARGPLDHPSSKLLCQLQSTPLGLQESCRKVIRGQFNFKTVDRLDNIPLPDILLNYVKFSDLNYDSEEEEEKEEEQEEEEPEE